MIKDKYYMHELIEKYYKQWIASPTLLGHSLDCERFYKFVKACIRYSKHRSAKQDIHGSWLRYFLERDLQNKYQGQYSDKLIHEAVVLFEHILEFSQTPFPDCLLEMRDPISVFWQLRRYKRTDVDGKETSYYSDDEIEKIMSDNFGLSWREKYRMQGW